MAQPPAPQLTEDEVDDLVYFARAGEEQDLAEALATAVSRVSKDSGCEAMALSVLSAAQDEGKNTALHMAAANGHEGVVKFILDQITGANSPAPARQAFLDAANSYGNTALHWAAMNGHLGVVKLLVEQGKASPALANDKNYVPLDLASFGDHGAVVDYFLAASEAAEGENADKGGLSGAAAEVDLGNDEDGAEEDNGDDEAAEASSGGKQA